MESTAPEGCCPLKAAVGPPPRSPPLRAASGTASAEKNGSDVGSSGAAGGSTAVQCLPQCWPIGRSAGKLVQQAVQQGLKCKIWHSLEAKGWANQTRNGTVETQCLSTTQHLWASRCGWACSRGRARGRQGHEAQWAQGCRVKRKGRQASVAGACATNDAMLNTSTDARTLPILVPHTCECMCTHQSGSCSGRCGRGQGRRCRPLAAAFGGH